MLVIYIVLQLSPHHFIARIPVGYLRDFEKFSPLGIKVTARSRSG